MIERGENARIPALSFPVQARGRTGPSCGKLRHKDATLRRCRLSRTLAARVSFEYKAHHAFRRGIRRNLPGSWRRDRCSCSTMFQKSVRENELEGENHM